MRCHVRHEGGTQPQPEETQHWFFINAGRKFQPQLSLLFPSGPGAEMADRLIRHPLRSLGPSHIERIGGLALYPKLIRISRCSAIPPMGIFCAEPSSADMREQSPVMID